MKLVFIMAALALPTFAFANTSALVAPGQTFEAQELCQNCGGSSTDYFSELGAAFDQGREASPEQVIGWTVGRCYRTEMRTIPRAGLLVGNEFVVGGNNGPLFPANRFVKILALAVHEATAFDDLASKPGVVAAMTKNLAQQMESIQPACSRDGSLVGISDQGAEYHMRVTADGQYLILKAVLWKDHDGRKAGETVGYCYYFKKIR